MAFIYEPNKLIAANVPIISSDLPPQITIAYLMIKKTQLEHIYINEGEFYAISKEKIKHFSHRKNHK